MVVTTFEMVATTFKDNNVQYFDVSGQIDVWTLDCVVANRVSKISERYMIDFKVESVEELPESIQDLYEKTDDGFELKITGMPEPDESNLTGLKKKVEELLTESKAAKKKARAAVSEAEQARMEAAKQGNDTEALHKSWESKFTTRESELQERIGKLTKTIVGLTSGQAAAQIASEIAIQGSASVLLPHIELRLRTETREDGSVETIVLDKNGQPSAMSIDELKKEFQNSASFAPLIVGTKANGAGRTGGKDSGGAATQEITRASFDSMSQVERSQYVKNGGKIIDD